VAIEQTQITQELPTVKAAKIVGLISDTHIPVRAKCIPKMVFKVFGDVDFIVHAGDLVELTVLDELEQLAPVLAVHGNMDGPHVVGVLPKLNSLKVSDWKIGVMHDPSTILWAHPQQQHKMGRKNPIHQSWKRDKSNIIPQQTISCSAEGNAGIHNTRNNSRITILLYD
jgi:hypothetical protein